MWWSGDFSDQLKVVGVEPRMSLENFTFFTNFSILPIPTDRVVTESAFDVITRVGSITFALVDGAGVLYDVDLVEEDGRYKFKFGLILNQPGAYAASLSTLSPLYDFYEHPAMYNYDCIGRRREDFRIHYNNSSTSRMAYDSILVEGITSEEANSTSFERHAKVGGFAFTVTE